LFLPIAMFCLAVIGFVFFFFSRAHAKSVITDSGASLPVTITRVSGAPCKAPSLCPLPVIPIAVPTSTTSTPTKLVVNGVTTSSISLSWLRPASGTTISGYLIYRGNNLAGTSPTTLFTDKNLSASTTYTYSVASYSASGAISGRSASVTGTTEGISSASRVTSMVMAIKNALTSNSVISAAKNFGFTTEVGSTTDGTPYVIVEQSPAGNIIGIFTGPQD